jgi:hypothetical protein
MHWSALKLRRGERVAGVNLTTVDASLKPRYTLRAGAVSK